VERVCYNFQGMGGRLRIVARLVMALNGKRKWMVVASVAGLVVLLLVLLAVRGQSPAVQMVSVARQDLNSGITTNGKVEPISPAIARAEFPAFVAAVKATEGQPVRRGEIILTLDAADVRAQLAQARGNLLLAQTDLRNARAGGPPDEVSQLQGDLEKARVQAENLERTHQSLTDLVAKQAATQDELAQNEALLAQARANLVTLTQKKDELALRSAVGVQQASLRADQAREEVESLETKVRSATVIAPADGTLYSLPVHAGDFVKLGDVLAEMADLRHVRVRAFVDEPDLGGLEPGQEVRVNWDAKPGRTWTGHTEEVPKQVVALGARSVGEVLCSIENDKLELLPNVNVQVDIMVREKRGVLVVPRSAVHYDKGQHYVFVFSGDKINRRDISVGIAGTSQYEVLSGLAADERVALPGEVELRNGMDVRATTEAN
jgi:HlyD family secretion protein